MPTEKGETLPKFFVEKDSIADGAAAIVGSDAAHIVKVLRLTSGDKIVLCDGEGTDYETEITQTDKNAVCVRVLRSYPCETEPKTEITLFQGIPKASKMEYIIQKCTELGVARIVPVMTKRTVVRLADGRDEAKKLDRWNKIAAEAVKQCGRGRIPRVDPVLDIPRICACASDFDLLLAAYEEERETSLRQVLKTVGNVRKVGIVIGSEGGFEKEEMQSLIAAGAKCVTLGKRILRTETAGHTVLTAVLYELGELE